MVFHLKFNFLDQSLNFRRYFRLNCKSSVAIFVGQQLRRPASVQSPRDLYLHLCFRCLSRSVSRPATEWLPIARPRIVLVGNLTGRVVVLVTIFYVLNLKLLNLGYVRKLRNARNGKISL